MTYMVYTLTDAETRVYAVAVMPGIAAPTRRGSTITPLPYSFETHEAATAYRDQLADYYGLATGRPPATMKIVCNETGEEWLTVAEAVRDEGCVYSQMINHINGKTGYKTVKGRTYRRVAIPTVPSVPAVPKRTESDAVICFQLPADNNRFPTVAEAARTLGVAAPAIFRHLRNPHQYRTVRGYTFARLDADGKPVMPELGA